MRYTGLNLEKELRDQSLTDHTIKLAGFTSKKNIFEIPENEREEYLPEGEVQRGAEDTQSCASVTPVELLETDSNFFMVDNRISPGNRQRLIDRGYKNIKSGKIDYSDAFIAIKSGTTRQGNSMIKPLQTIRKFGLIPKKLLPLEPWMTWEDYHNPKRITKEMEILGLQFLEMFDISYERVHEPTFEEWLKKEMLCLAGHAWSPVAEGEYPRVHYPINHEFAGLKLPKTYIRDSYKDAIGNDFIKKLAHDYKFLPYGYRIFFSKEKQPSNAKWWHFITNLFKWRW